MNILIVHSHHEPKSFCSALRKQAEESLIADGHEVVVSDLPQMGFDPISDRRNFQTTKDEAYLKQQIEELHATETNSFASDLEAEMQKLEKCDAVLFCFPLWWFGMPAQLKGWCDRVLAMGRIYGGPKLYEGGIGQSQKRGMILMTTGGGPDAYDGWGLNPAMDSVLAPIQHGIFWFNGFLPLEPFIAWSPVRISDEQRAEYLRQLDQRMKTLFSEKPIQLPRLEDFPGWGHDQKQRYEIVVTRRNAVDDEYLALVPEELKTLEIMKREGILLSFRAAAMDDPNWKAFLTFRVSNEYELKEQLKRLPLHDHLIFEATQIQPLG